MSLFAKKVVIKIVEGECKMLNAECLILNKQQPNN